MLKCVPSVSPVSSVKMVCFMECPRQKFLDVFPREASEKSATYFLAGTYFPKISNTCKFITTA